MNKYYTVLGLEPGATREEIKRAYRRLSMKHHPDKNQGSKESEEKFREILEAYDMLKDYEWVPEPKQHTYGYTSYTNDQGSYKHRTDWSGQQTFYTHTTTRNPRYTGSVAPNRSTLYAFLFPFLFALIRMMSCSQDTYLPDPVIRFNSTSTPFDTTAIGDLLRKEVDTSNPFTIIPK